jgi:hypothetical protein
MAGFANNIQGIGLIDPYLNYTDPLGEIENLQMQADQIFTNGIKIALADSPGDNTTVSIAGAIVPNPPFTYSHNEMGAAKDVFNFIFSQIME